MISRRDFMKGVSTAALAAASIRPLVSWADDAPLAIPGKDGMIVRSYRFLDLEMPVEYANSFITPVPHFFVRNHMHPPSTLDESTWKLTISGEVEKPLTLTLADLHKLDSHSVINTLECAGNGRGLQAPHVPGIQWQKGAVGNAKFAGPPLHELLSRAGVKPTAKHVAFFGLDEVPGKVPPIYPQRSNRKSDGLRHPGGDSMNGSTLPKHHGFPARAVVPGWIGAASCKWLTEIKVLDQEFEGNFMNPGYRMPNQPVKPGEAVKPEDTHVVTTLTVKSLIASSA